MIEQDLNFSNLEGIFKKYKNDYNPIINKFTHNIIYKKGSKIVAFVIYTVIYENVEIVDIFVLNDCRKEKIGTKLLNKIISENLDKNITLEVNKNNKVAINLYKKLGFEIVAIRKKYYDNGDGLLMLKK